MTDGMNGRRGRRIGVWCDWPIIVSWIFRWEEKLVAPLIAVLYVDRTNERHKKRANAKRRSLRDIRDVVPVFSR